MTPDRAVPPATSATQDRLVRAVRVSLLVGVVTLAAFVVTRVVSWDAPRPAHLARGTPLSFGLEVAQYAAMLAIAAVLLARVPRNAVSWIPLIAMLSSAGTAAADGLARWALGAGLSGTVPLTAAWVTQWAWVANVLGFGALLLLYPSGRPPSPRWRWFLVAIGVGGALMLVVLMFSPGPLFDFPQLRNPAGIAVLPSSGSSSSPNWLIVLLFGSMLVLNGAALVSLLVRFSRARGVERQQVKVLAFAASVFLVFQFVIADRLPTAVAAVGTSLTGIGLMVAITLAVLRYRLYEIDRIISRTATYAVVTALLGGLYALVAVVPSVLLGLDSDLFVAAATLAVAAAFGTVRRRVQAVIDRRFDRARYDAEQVAARFVGRLRHEIDPDELLAAVVGVVQLTVQPSSLSVWARRDPEP